MNNLTGRYVLFAWQRFYPKGGFNDNCGLFESPSFALEFFNKSDHYSYFEYYQIVDIETLNIISEGRRK